MVQQHAAELAEETQALRLQLQPVFKVTAGAPERTEPSAEPLTTVRGASDTTAQLVELAAEQARELRGAFSACSTPPCELPDPQRLLQSLSDLERLASRFNQFYLKLPHASDRLEQDHE
jgi:hypothetical protein